MIAYKGFHKGLVCRDYQFHMGLNVTDQANCRKNGFHCAENPLDCLSYYSDMDQSEYYLVDAGGDVNEDGLDTKISCTELTILKKLDRQEFFMHALAYMHDHPKREWSEHVNKERGDAGWRKFTVVRGEDPAAKGPKGSLLALAKEDADGKIIRIALLEVDGKKYLPDTWYGADLEARRDAA